MSINHSNRGKQIKKTTASFPVTPSFSSGDEPKYLACANQKQVVVYETSDWTTHLNLTDAKLSGSFTVCGFSVCGKFIAAGTTKGELVVWTAGDGKRVSGKAEGESDEPITSLAWSTNGIKQFVYADKSGQIGCVNVETGGGSDRAAGRADIVDGMETENNCSYKHLPFPIAATGAKTRVPFN